MENPIFLNFDELFNTANDISETPKMTKDEFITKTKDLLLKIEKEYSNCWTNKILTDEEYEQNNCDDWDGRGLLKINGEEVECFGNEDGDCYYRYFDTELFAEEMENIMIHDEKSDFFDLLCCDIEN